MVIILSCIQKHPVQFLAAHNLSWLRFLAFFSLSSWMWGQYLSYSFIRYYNGKIMTVPPNILKLLKNPFEVWVICSIIEWTKNKIKSIFVLSFHPYLGVISGFFQSNFLTDILYVYFIPAAWCVLCSSHLCWFVYHNNCEENVFSLLLFPSSFSHFLHHWSKYYA